MIGIKPLVFFDNIYVHTVGVQNSQLIYCRMRKGSDTV